MSKTERGKEEKKHTDTHTHNKDGSFSPIGLVLGQKKKKTNCLLNAESHCRPLYFKICVLGLFEMESVFFFFFSPLLMKRRKNPFSNSILLFFFCYCH